MNPVWSQEFLKAAQADRLSAKNPELRAWSALQLQQFLECGFPKRSDENWKYTSIAPILEQPFSTHSSKAAVSTRDIEACFLPNTHRLVFVDGVFAPTLSDLKDVPEQVVLTHAASEPCPMDQNLHSPSPFTFLNGALIADGLFLHVPEGISLKKTIHLLYVTTQNMQHPRHFLQLSAGAQAAVLEDYIGFGDHIYFNNAVTCIEVGAHAQLTYYKFQRENAGAFHTAHTEIYQKRGSRVQTYHIAAGSRLNREDLQVALEEEGAECALTGFYYPKGEQHIDYHTCIAHQAARTESRQYYKGILEESGRGVFNGKVKVSPNVRHIKADQANHNLLLSKSVEIDAKPELEIYSSDVQCTHGATIGYLDQNALFYLRSRGIPETIARQILLTAFTHEILERFPDVAIAERARQILLLLGAGWPPLAGGVLL